MVSIRDVAKQAGVAISTVSKVLNHYPNVSEDTKAKVNAAIEELGFVPNSIASALSSKKTDRVALLLDVNRHVQTVDEIPMQYIVGSNQPCQRTGNGCNYSLLYDDPGDVCRRDDKIFSLPEY